MFSLTLAVLAVTIVVLSGRGAGHSDHAPSRSAAAARARLAARHRRADRLWPAGQALIAGPPRGAATGTQSFGLIAAILLLVAALIGLLSLVLHYRRKRMLGIAVGVHASVAIFGYVILSVYLLAG